MEDQPLIGTDDLPSSAKIQLRSPTDLDSKEQPNPHFHHHGQFQGAGAVQNQSEKSPETVGWFVSREIAMRSLDLQISQWSRFGPRPQRHSDPGESWYAKYFV